MPWIVPPDPTGQWLALDLETTGTHWKRDKAFFMALTYRDGSSFGLDLREPNELQWAKDHVHKAAGLANHNLKFDLHFLREAGIRFPEKVKDTMINAALLNEFLLSYSLDDIAKKYLGESKVDIYPELAELFGGQPTRKAQILNLQHAPREMVEKYALQDTRLIFPLLDYQEPRLAGEGLERTVALEQDLLLALLDLEHEGVRIDEEQARRVLAELREEQRIVQAQLNQMCGWNVAVMGRKDMERILQPRWVGDHFEIKDGTPCLLTKGSGKTSKKTGKVAEDRPSLNSDLLQECSLPEAKLIVQVRKLEKLCGTFMEGHVLGNLVNGRVFPHFHQTKSADDDGDTYGTSSGRMSCSDPNLTNIPARNPRFKKLLRSIFLPEEGHVWASADFASIDFRVMCNFLRDPNIDRAYAENPDLDFHQLVANMTGLPRGPKEGIKGNAKQINLGCAFGTSAGRVAKEMGLPFTVERKMLGGELRDLYIPGPEALEIFDRYHAELPLLKPMLDRMKAVARERGYIRTMIGRRSRFPGGQMVHKAGPLIFQGGAAELMKTALVRLHRHFRGETGRLLNTVHDEASLSFPEGREDLCREMVHIMESREDVPEMRIPVRVELALGKDWAEAGQDGYVLMPSGVWRNKKGETRERIA